MGGGRLSISSEAVRRGRGVAASFLVSFDAEDGDDETEEAVAQLVRL